MRLLISTSGEPVGSSWPVLADEQIVCGPLQLDLSLGEAIFSRSTPAGAYDLAEVVAGLPPGQRPDVIACVVDGATVDLPRGLGQCPGVKLLLVGDTQNSPEGLDRLIAYAQSEPFDRIVFTHGCLDERFFVAAGFENLFWFPGLLCRVRDWIIPVIRGREKTRSLGSEHPTRERHSALNTRLAALAQVDVQSATWSAALEERLGEIGHSEINLVASERGEWSDRLFEVRAAGGFLVTGNLGAHAGLDRVWPEGAPFAVVDDPLELTTRVPQWLEDPTEPRRFGAAAAQWYDSFLGDGPRRAAFGALALQGVAPVASRPWTGVHTDAAHLSGAIAALHHALESGPVPRVFAGEGVPASALALIERFPRLEVVPGPEAQGRFDFVVAAKASRMVSGPFVWYHAPLAAPTGYEAMAATPGLYAERTHLKDALSLRDASAALHSGNYPKAVEFASREIAQRPESVEANLILADLFLEKNSTAGFEKHRGILRRIAHWDPRVLELDQRAARRAGRTAERQVRQMVRSCRSSSPADALKALEPHAEKHPELLPLAGLQAELLERAGDRAAATAAWYRVARHHPNDDHLWFVLGLSLWRSGQLAEAGFALRRAADHSPHEPVYQRVFATALALEPTIPVHAGRRRNLVVAGAENCGRHGVGVMIDRYFGRHLDTITLRASTSYDGVEETGSAHFLLEWREGAPPAEVQTHMRRLLAPYEVKRIMCIPGRRCEIAHGAAAHEVTGGRLCTFVMDDRNVLEEDTDDVHLQDLFERSSLRLVISAEMQMAYAIKYEFDFDVMPPVVANRDARRVNRWNAKTHPSTRVALLGNIWTLSQFLQLLKFMENGRLVIDWFGPKPNFDLTGSGINVMGRIDPETALADRLAEYPLVLVPSGMLDGSENDEWLTRLSLPSRIVFLMQTGIPILVLGSPHTCASRYVLSLGIGRTMPYSHPDPIQVLTEMTRPAARATYAANCAKAAEAFVMPECGAWIWDSIDAGHALPAPFQDYFPRYPEIEILWPASAAGRIPISHVELQPA